MRPSIGRMDSFYSNRQPLLTMNELAYFCKSLNW